jgi:hypothetical protein
MRILVRGRYANDEVFLELWDNGSPTGLNPVQPDTGCAGSIPANSAGEMTDVEMCQLGKLRLT